MTDLPVATKIPAAKFANFLDEEIYVIREKSKNPFSKSAGQGKANWVLKGDIFSTTLLVVNYPGKKEIPAVDKTFLSAILSAVGLGMPAVCWLNLSENEGFFWNNLNEMKAKNILCFGLDESFWGQAITLMDPIGINGKTIIPIQSLAEVASDAAIKKSLWQQLKKIYHV
ncbi:MAG: hypothetical protein NTX03_07555 [Bacteroidetes bacterium]|nr:hypothetical protein [Bacteroidota bacterium]